MATSTSSVSLKLLIDTKNQKVLFAEAGKDFIDFLFTLLSLPVGTLVRLLSTNGMVGSLGKLYSSFENLSDTYIQPNFNKDTLLKPSSPLGSPVTLLSLANDMSSGRKLYVCSGSRSSPTTFGSLSSTCGKRHAADSPLAVCPGCGEKTSIEVTYIGPADPQVGSSEEGGFVKGVVTYMVMDDLEVKPMSTISSITMLNKFNVKEVGALEERIVSLEMDQGLKLLKASLQMKNVLTHVFLGK